MPFTNVHLVVIHHGLWGTPANTSFLATTLAKHHGGTASPSTALSPPESTTTLAVHAESHPNAKRDDVRLIVMNTEVNAGDHTYDGVDWCGQRLVQDIYREVERIEKEEGDGVKVEKLSLVGYSLGGLVIRYAAGVMYADGFFCSSTSKEGKSKRQEKEFKFESRPVAASLSTIATPHLGVTLTGSTFSKVAKAVGSAMLGRSGRQLYLADRGWISPSSSASSPDEEREREGDEEGLCLIEALSDPRFCFLPALQSFQRIDIYANAVADLTVSYRTAAFEAHDPFYLPHANPNSSAGSSLALTRDTDHPVLLTSYAAKEAGEPPKNSIWKKLGNKISPRNLPWILNPQRFPFSFPLNYVAWVCLPVLLPVMLGLVLHKLRGDSKKSNKRVGVLEELWGVENGHLPPSGTNGNVEDDDGAGKKKGKAPKAKVLDKATKQSLERKRVSGLLSTFEAEVEETLREVGEDYVATEEPASSSTSEENDSNGRYTVKPNNATLSLSPSTAFTYDPKEQPLTPTQHRIIATLNDKSVLPQVKKHLAHFQDVLNAHAVIIVRTTTLETHRKGTGLIRAFVERFGL